ncbi:MAG: hypothetical protein JWN73_920 [Betaproteobacteria bacterium]|nr:hypothetical protein [Betaproteobacteria bacterium]
MSDLNAFNYKGHSIEPLVYAHLRPRQGKSAPLRRYQAAVSVTNVETGVKRTERLAVDFEFFGDARRAAGERGQSMIDNPDSVAEASPFEPVATPSVPVASPFEPSAAA